MALLASSNLSKQTKLLSTLDALTSVLEKFPDNKCQNNDVDNNPFSLLMSIISKCGVTEEAIIQWVIRILKVLLPVIELGIKGILLANIKDMISCSVDPFIPDYARNPNSGFTFKLSELDINDLLSTSPLDVDNKLYFGIPDDEMISPYDFLRPVDFNAFLWYVIHRGRYPSPSLIETDTRDTTKEFTTVLLNTYSANTVYGGNILRKTELRYLEETNTSGIICGNSFRQKITNNGVDFYLNNISVCSKVKRNENTKQIIFNRLLPVSSHWKRTNYYVNRETYIFNLSEKFTDQVLNRNNDNDIALCTFEYIDDFESGKTINTNDYMDNVLRISILPKPFIHIPQVGQLLPSIIPILYNCNGNKDIINGNFTLLVHGKCNSNLEELYDEKTLKELYQKAKDNPIDTYKSEAYWWYNLYYNDDKEEKTISPYILVIDYKGKYWVQSDAKDIDISNEIKGNEILPLLQECYPKLTIYEFNYDYIMSMRLFESKQILAQIINGILQSKTKLIGGGSLGISTKVYEGQERIVSIIKEMIEANDYESSDCFFSFSNEKYDEMSRNAELQRSKLIPFGTDVNDISSDLSEINNLLDNFGDSATNNENVETFSRLMAKVNATVENEGSEGYERQKLNYNFFLQIITNLVTTLLNTIITPKILLMFLINKQLCQKDAISNAMTLTPEKLLKEIEGVIVQMVKEIRDLILKELLNFVLKQLSQILELLAIKLVLEQTEAYRNLIRQLLKNCFHHRRRGEIATELDKVNYADIDEPQEQPNSDKC